MHSVTSRCSPSGTLRWSGLASPAREAGKVQTRARLEPCRGTSSFGTRFNYDFHVTLDAERRPARVQLKRQGGTRSAAKETSPGSTKESRTGPKRLLPASMATSITPTRRTPAAAKSLTDSSSPARAAQPYGQQETSKIPGRLAAKAHIRLISHRGHRVLRRGQWTSSWT